MFFNYQVWWNRSNFTVIIIASNNNYSIERYYKLRFDYPNYCIMDSEAQSFIGRHKIVWISSMLIVYAKIQCDQKHNSTENCFQYSLLFDLFHVLTPCIFLIIIILKVIIWYYFLGVTSNINATFYWQKYL